VLWTHTSKIAKVGTDLIAEHVGVVIMCSTTKFSFIFFAVFDL